MIANNGVMRARQPIRVPLWLVIGVALTLTGSLAVVTLSDRGTSVTPAREPVVVGSVAGSPDSVAEMAALKAALATGEAFRLGDGSAQLPRLGHRWAERQYAVNSAAEIAWLKAHLFGRH